MAANSGIEWTKHTANLWWGCTKVHAGCDNCYAETLSNRYGIDVWGNDNPRKSINGVWGELFRFQASASASSEIHTVFVGSMMDIFEKPMPCVDSKGEKVLGGTGMLRERFFNEVVPNSPNLMFLLLTKRPSNINKMIPNSWLSSPPKNVMFGTSPCDEETYKTLVPQLMRVNGKRFLSIEPQIEKIVARVHELRGIDWVIQGGESGPKRRGFSTEWARVMRDNCYTAGVPYFFKQIDKVQQIPKDLEVRQFPNFLYF